MRPLLTKDKILEALSTLADELPPDSPITIRLVGGAVMAIQMETRDSTRDVDAGERLPHAVTEAAGRVAEKLGLEEGWINDGPSALIASVSDGAILLRRGPLTVRAVTIEQMAALKLCAQRTDQDIDDARQLLGRIRRGVSRVQDDMESVWVMLEPYLLPEKQRKARDLFEDLWEMDL